MKLLSYQKALEVLAKSLLNEVTRIEKHKVIHPFVYSLIKMKSSGQDVYCVIAISTETLRRKGKMIVSLDDEVHYVTVKGNISTKRINGAFWMKGCDTWQIQLH